MSQFNVDKSLIFKELKKFLEEKNFKAVSLKISECLN